MSENVTVTRGIFFFFDQRKLPGYIKILNSKCEIKSVKVKERKAYLPCSKEIQFC